MGLKDGQEEALTRVRVAHDGNPLQPLAVPIVREGWRTEMPQKDSLRLSDWLYMGGRGKRHQNVHEVTLGV